MKLELMQGIKALEGGDAKYSEISSMCLMNEHVVARAVQQNQNLSGAEKWQEVHDSLVGLKAQIKEQQKFAASQSKPPAVAKPPSAELPAFKANNDSIIPMLSFGVACAGLALGLAAFLKK